VPACATFAAAAATTITIRSNTMTTPALATAATSQPEASTPPAAALWRALCTLATALDARVIAEEDPGAVVNVVLCHGGNPADIDVICKYVATLPGQE
jgi:hypothetical protein